MHAAPLDRSSAVYQYYFIYLKEETGMSEQQWDGIYKLMVDNGFAKT